MDGGVLDEDDQADLQRLETMEIEELEFTPAMRGGE